MPGQEREVAGEPTAILQDMRGHLLTNHPLLGVGRCVSATVPTLKFSPGLHINYAETVLPMRDGLPKFKDVPAEFGGSGQQMAE